MDFLGWFAIGTLGVLATAATLWGRRQTRRRAGLARVWAKAHQLEELAPKMLPFAQAQTVRRDRSLPAFRGSLEGVTWGVFQWRTHPRYGPVWIVCAVTRHPRPVLIRRRADAATARITGHGSPKGFARVKLDDDAFDQHLAIDIPASISLEDALPLALRQAILRNYPPLWTFLVRSDGLVAVFVQDWLSRGTEASLTAGRDILKVALDTHIESGKGGRQVGSQRPRLESKMS